MKRGSIDVDCMKLSPRLTDDVLSRASHLILECSGLLLEPCCFEVVDDVSDAPVGRVWQLTVLHGAGGGLGTQRTDFSCLKAATCKTAAPWCRMNVTRYLLTSTEPFALSSMLAVREDINKANHSSVREIRSSLLSWGNQDIINTVTTNRTLLNSWIAMNT